MRVTAHVEYDGYNWVATVDGVPGAVTQGRRLDLIPGRVAEVYKLISGNTVTVDDVDLEVHFGDEELDSAAADIEALEADVEDMQSRLADRRRYLIDSLRQSGHSLRDIAVVTHVSYQRVHQLAHDSK